MRPAMPSPLCRSLQDFMVIAVAEGAGQKFVATGKTDSQRPWSLSVVSSGYMVIIFWVMGGMCKPMKY